MTIIAMALGAIMEVTGIDIDPETVAATFGPAAAYVVSRGISKVNRPNG